MTLAKRIQSCKTLTPVEMIIADYILKNEKQIVQMTILEMADSIHVSKSALHRFSKKIGLKGFNDIKVEISKNQVDMEDQWRQVDANYPFLISDDFSAIAYKLMKLYEATIHDSLACLDEVDLENVVSILNRADVIDIYTHAHNINIAENFQDKMMTIGRTVNCPKSFYNQRMQVLASNEKHIALILSYSGRASWILPIAKKLYEKRIPAVMISKIGSYHFSQYIPYHLAISGNEKLQNRISQFSSHIGLQYIMDVLYGCIYNQDREKNRKYVYESIDYMDDRFIKDTEK